MVLQQPPILTLHIFHPKHLRRKRAEPILDSHDLVCTFLAGLDDLAILFADIVLGLQHRRALTLLLGVGAASIRELERRGSVELEKNLDLATLVDVRLHLLTLGNTGRGERVNSLGDVDRSAALGCPVTNRGNRELTGVLGDTAESRGGRFGPRLLAVEGIPNLEGSGTSEGVPETFADAVVGASLERINGGRLKELDLNRVGLAIRSISVGRCVIGDRMAAAAVANAANANRLGSKAQLVTRDLDLVRVGVDCRRTVHFRNRAALVSDFELKVEGRDAVESDGNRLGFALVRLAVLEGLTGLGEGGSGFLINLLLNSHGLESPVISVEVIRK